MDDEWFVEKLQEIDKATKLKNEKIKEIVSEIVPTYQYQKKYKIDY